MKKLISTLMYMMPLCMASGVKADWYRPHPGRPGGMTSITCESNGYRYNRCGVGGPIREVRIWRQHSHSPCIEGRSWGWDRGSIWVDNGCRATFQVFVGGGWGDGGGWGGHR